VVADDEKRSWVFRGIVVDTNNPASVKNDPILRHFPTMLHRWRGGQAIMLELTSSHKSLTIRVKQEGRPGNVIVACVGPRHIHGPVYWENACIEIRRIDETGYLVYDAGADVEITCDAVEIAENTKRKHG
jgi:hypothetical protein